jgi:hypothetical protein
LGRKTKPPHFGNRETVTIKNLAMIQALNLVILTIDIPSSLLQKGDLGTVVMNYDNGKAFDVEFIATDGSTIAVEHLTLSQIRTEDSK